MFVIGELRAEVGSVGEVVVRRLDTSDLTSVRTFAKEVLDTEKAIHVLVSVVWWRERSADERVFIYDYNVFLSYYWHLRISICVVLYVSLLTFKQILFISPQTGLPSCWLFIIFRVLRSTMPAGQAPRRER